MCKKGSYAVDECKGNEGNQKGNWLKGREGKLSICRLMIGGMNYCISGQCNRKERDTVLEEFMGYRVSHCCSGKSEIFFCEIKFVLFCAGCVRYGQFHWLTTESLRFCLCNCQCTSFGGTGAKLSRRLSPLFPAGGGSFWKSMSSFKNFSFACPLGNRLKMNKCTLERRFLAWARWMARRSSNSSCSFLVSFFPPSFVPATSLLLVGVLLLLLRLLA